LALAVSRLRKITNQESQVTNRKSQMNRATQKKTQDQKVQRTMARKPESAAMELDRVIHERLRLGILSALAVNNSLSFNELKQILKTTDGNLSVHARKLEDAEYVSCEKSFEGRVPRTEYKITTTGRRALERYLDSMEQVIAAARKR
jgi:DNA-binding MarR family transcriptional regulator